MKFLQKLIPGFLNRLDHRLLINKPNIWRTKAHYLLFYAIIIIALVFSCGCFYPHSIQSEVYGSAEQRDNIAIFITFAMSIVIIIFWSTRLYQFQTKISRWKHFFYTFCIYFICLFILFTSVFSFHYGSFINRTNLLTDYKDTYKELTDKNFFIPVYFPHYHKDVLNDLDNYIDNGKALSSNIYQSKEDMGDFYYTFLGRKGYSEHSVEFFERMNLVKDYLHDLEEKKYELKVDVAQVYQNELLDKKVQNYDKNEVAKRAINFGLGKEGKAFIEPVKIGGENYQYKLSNGMNSLTKSEFDTILGKVQKPGLPKPDSRIWIENNKFSSAMLFRYEHYLRLRNFLSSLNDQQYNGYVNYLKQLDTLEQVQFYMDDHLIQYHEVSSIISYEKVEDSIPAFSYLAYNNFQNKWLDRFMSKSYLVDYSEKPTANDTKRTGLLKDFFKALDTTQINKYIEYVHFTRILNTEIENAKRLNVFNAETGLEDYVFEKCNKYFNARSGDLNRMDSILFFNYFDSGIYSIKLGPDYYPKIIQKTLFDKFYKEDLSNETRIKDLMVNNGFVSKSEIGQRRFNSDPDLLYKRQFMNQAFEHVGIIRSEATDLKILFTFLLANMFFSFCFAILIFYLSSVERNTILMALFIMGLIYISLLALGSIDQGLVGALSILFYLLFSLSLFIVFYKPKFQIKRIKLIITSYIFYAISIQFFMLSNEDFIIDVGIAPELMAFMILIFTFTVLFFYSYSFIRYIQLPAKD